VLESRLHQATFDNHARQEEIRSLFAAAGCDPAKLEERKMKHGKWANVICTLPSANDALGEIVVGAHFDHVATGDGVIDNWSGAALLSSLFESMKVQPRRHTFIFISFADEENGLNGSRDFAKSLSKDERSSIRAMANLDSLAAGTTAIWMTRADKRLADDAARVARSLKVPLRVFNVDGAGDSDSKSFRDLGIPVIDFHSLDRYSFPVIHSSHDNFNAVDMTAYTDSFRLISTFLGFIDQQFQ
jgi:Zn-dependent M28 family amino/carboxypeptidase